MANLFNILTESDIAKIKACVNDERFPHLNEYQKGQMETLIGNAVANNLRALNEGTLSADVAQFTPIIAPLVRRIYPNLIANEILGVQAMSMPTGYIYALVNNYSGDSVNKISPLSKGILVKTDVEATDVNVGATVNTDYKVIYKEGLYVLLTKGATAITPGTTQIGTTAKIMEVYTNEAAFLHILKGYSGPYATADAEKLGTDMKELGFTIAKKSIEAKSRALKGQYTVEMFQDLQTQHGLLADVELMNLLEYELRAEIDRECVDFVNSVATQLPDTTFPAAKLSDGATVADLALGTWEIERFRTQAIRIAKESTIIGVETKRGQGNVLLVSPKVACMLGQLGNFKVAPIAGNIDIPVAGGYAGTFDNKYRVIVDQYATNDYITVLYKGATNRDALGFFAPYVPLSFTRVTNQDSGQPAVIAKMRYALTAIPGVESGDSLDRAKTYARSWGIDFTHSILG